MRQCAGSKKLNFALRRIVELREGGARRPEPRGWSSACDHGGRGAGASLFRLCVGRWQQDRRAPGGGQRFGAQATATSGFPAIRHALADERSTGGQLARYFSGRPAIPEDLNPAADRGFGCRPSSRARGSRLLAATSVGRLTGARGPALSTSQARASEIPGGSTSSGPREADIARTATAMFGPERLLVTKHRRTASPSRRGDGARQLPVGTPGQVLQLSGNLAQREIRRASSTCRRRRKASSRPRNFDR